MVQQRRNFSNKPREDRGINDRRKSRFQKYSGSKDENPALEQERRTRRSPDTNGEEEINENLLLGRNPIREAIRSGRSIEKILVARGDLEGSIRQIMNMAKERKIVIQEVDRSRLDELTRGGNHQGMAAFTAAHQYVEVSDILEKARQSNEDPFIIVLDEITDPHNLGSILRTAECCGAHGVIIPKRRAVGLTATVAKTSAGALEYIPVAKVTNIGATLDELKKQGMWVAGADIDGEVYYKSNLKGALALVIGSEGQGIGRLVKEKCDFIISIPLKGNIESLNASVAAGILMYEAAKQRMDRNTQ